MVQIFGDWTRISLESFLDVDILSTTFGKWIFTVTSCDHPSFILRLNLPEFFLINVINLFFGRNTIPEEEILNLLVVLTQIELTPNFVDRVSPDTHSPDVLTILHVQVLRDFHSRGVELIDEPNDLDCLKLCHPLVHELTRKLLFVFLICAVELFSIHVDIKFTIFVGFFKITRDEHRGSESFVCDDGLVPFTAGELLSLFGSLWIVHWVRVQVQMSWLHELVHKVYGFRLLISNGLLTPSSEQIVDLLSTVLLVPVVLDPPLKSSSFLFDENKKCETLDGPSGGPSEVLVQ